MASASTSAPETVVHRKHPAPHSHIIRWPIAFISLHFTPGNTARQVNPAPQQQVAGQPFPTLNFTKNVVFSEKQQIF